MTPFQRVSFRAFRFGKRVAGKIFGVCLNSVRAVLSLCFVSAVIQLKLQSKGLDKFGLLDTVHSGAGEWSSGDLGLQDGESDGSI